MVGIVFASLDKWRLYKSFLGWSLAYIRLWECDDIFMWGCVVSCPKEVITSACFLGRILQIIYYCGKRWRQKVVQGKTLHNPHPIYKTLSVIWLTKLVINSGSSLMFYTILSGWGKVNCIDTFYISFNRWLTKGCFWQVKFCYVAEQWGIELNADEKNLSLVCVFSSFKMTSGSWHD